MARVLFFVGLVGLHLARVLSTLGLVALFKIGFSFILARVLFTFGLAGVHVASVLSTSGLVALHLAWAFLDFGYFG